MAGEQLADEGGFALLWRRYFDHPFWTERRVFNRAEAWIDCWANMAAHTTHERMIGGRRVVLQRGQFLASERYLETRWRWSRGKVRRFIQAVQDMEMMCVVGDTTDGTIYAIVNYDTYQPRRPTDETTDSTSDGPATDQRETKKAIKAGNTNGPSEDELLFEIAWKAYPRRPNNPKAKALKAWNARLREGVEARDMLAGVDRYARFCAAELASGRMTSNRFIKQAATFFGPDRHWEDPFEVGDNVLSLAAHMTADYLATILNMAGNGVWSGETRDAALYRTSQNFDADEWAMIVPYLDHFPWAEARAAKADKFMLRDVLKRHIARTDWERAHAA